ncbi:MAG TPA: hypothetical protein VGF77_08245 [Allosphingosinicella sp.]
MAGPEPRRHHQRAAAFADDAADVAAAEVGAGQERTGQRKDDLPAMGMPGQHQWNVGRDPRELVGAVHDHDPGAGQEPHPAVKRLLPRHGLVPSLGIIVEAADHERAHRDRRTVQQADMGARQDCRDPRAPGLMVVIAEHRIDAERRRELRQRRQSLIRIVAVRRPRADEIAGPDDDVRPQRVDPVDDRGDPPLIRFGPFDVEIGEEQELEGRAARRPAGEAESGMADDGHLDGVAIAVAGEDEAT